MEGGGAAISARVADECSRALGQKSSEEGERAHADLILGAKAREVDGWKSFQVFNRLRAGDVIGTAVDTRRPLAWEMVRAKKL